MPFAMGVMRVPRRAAACLLLALSVGVPVSWAQAPPRRPAFTIYDEFDRQAAVSDPTGIQTYSKNLIRSLLPPEAGESDIKPLEPLVDRLARAEQKARTGEGKFVAEADVVRAFNELMAQVGAPSSLRADEASMRSFREHAVSIKAFPALLSANRNGMNCNPGEAVFLLYLLISNNGVLYEKSLDRAQELTQWNGQRQGTGRSFGVVGTTALGSRASGLLSSYTSSHSRNATIQLFNHLAGILGF